MRAVGVVAAVLVSVAWMPATADRGGLAPATVGELNDWLVANGLLAREVADQLEPVQTPVVPAVPAALPGTMGNPKGCSGLNGVFGSDVTPKGVAGMNCGFAVQTGTIWSISLAQAAYPGGISSAFHLVENSDFFNFGIEELYCSVPWGTGTYVIEYQQHVGVHTPYCTAWGFGADPFTWGSWLGFAGGFGVPGSWDATVLIR